MTQKHCSVNQSILSDKKLARFGPVNQSCFEDRCLSCTRSVYFDRWAVLISQKDPSNQTESGKQVWLKLTIFDSQEMEPVILEVATSEKLTKCIWQKDSIKVAVKPLAKKCTSEDSKQCGFFIIIFDKEHEEFLSIKVNKEWKSAEANKVSVKDFKLTSVSPYPNSEMVLAIFEKKIFKKVHVSDLSTSKMVSHFFESQQGFRQACILNKNETILLIDDATRKVFRYQKNEWDKISKVELPTSKTLKIFQSLPGRCILSTQAPHYSPHEEFYLDESSQTLSFKKVLRHPSTSTKTPLQYIDTSEHLLIKYRYNFEFYPKSTSISGLPSTKHHLGHRLILFSSFLSPDPALLSPVLVRLKASPSPSRLSTSPHYLYVGLLGPLSSFVRCHRGYSVQGEYVVKIGSSRGEIGVRVRQAKRGLGKGVSLDTVKEIGFMALSALAGVWMCFFCSFLRKETKRLEIEERGYSQKEEIVFGGVHVSKPKDKTYAEREGLHTNEESSQEKSEEPQNQPYQKFGFDFEKEEPAKEEIQEDIKVTYEDEYGEEEQTGEKEFHLPNDSDLEKTPRDKIEEVAVKESIAAKTGGALALEDSQEKNDED